MSGVWEEYADTDMMEMGFGGGGTIVDILKQHRLRVGETLAMKNGELGYYSSRVYSEGKVWETIIFDDGDPEYVLVDNPVFEERFDQIKGGFRLSSFLDDLSQVANAGGVVWGPQNLECHIYARIAIQRSILVIFSISELKKQLPI